MFRWPSEITFDLDKLLVTVVKETQWVNKCHITHKKKKKEEGMFACKRNKLASRRKKSVIINPSLQLERKGAVYGLIFKIYDQWNI